MGRAPRSAVRFVGSGHRTLIPRTREPQILCVRQDTLRGRLDGSGVSDHHPSAGGTLLLPYTMPWRGFGVQLAAVTRTSFRRCMAIGLPGKIARKSVFTLALHGALHYSIISSSAKLLTKQNLNWGKHGIGKGARRPPLHPAGIAHIRLRVMMIQIHVSYIIQLCRVCIQPWSCVERQAVDVLG